MKTAIITGSSRGIGAAVAERLAKDGHSVVINYSNDSTGAEKLVEKIKAAGGKAIAVKADVSDPQAVTFLFDTSEKEFGRIDILVNNAGIMKLAPISQTTDELFNQTIDINLKGVFNCLREAKSPSRRGEYHQFLFKCCWIVPAYLWSVCCDKICCRGPDSRRGQRAWI